MDGSIGRNAPCPCGSGKKYKNCCLKTRRHAPEKAWEDKVVEAGQLSLENTPDGPRKAIEAIEKLMGAPGLAAAQRVHGLFNLARALQHGGDFSRALSVLSDIAVPKDFERGDWLEMHLRLNKASCRSALGQHALAVEDAAAVLRQLSVIPKSEHPGFLLECGKVFHLAGDNDRAGDCWLKALELAKDEPEQIEIYARVLANLADLKLHDPDLTVQQDGVAMMATAAYLKVGIGDLHGLANSYDLLGLYYWRTRQFEPAIAYLRKDLALSRQVGDRRGLAQTLANIAGLYMQLRQVKAARQALEEAKLIAVELGNPDLDVFVARQIEAIEGNARDLAAKGERFGPKVACACGSGKTYQECCGRADFAPVDLPWNFGGLSEDAQQIKRQLSAMGIKPTRLDLFLASWEAVENRLAWFKVFPRLGWDEVYELPDMASIQLSAARNAANTAKKHAGSFEWPLSALILSACALESFINQVAFFITEVAKGQELGLGPLPRELMGDVFTFQRTTELTQKWAIIGKFLCGSFWPPVYWDEFVNLVFVRNEFVHFKVPDYEQVIPPPRDPPKILRRLPADFKLADMPHSWVFRILTPQLAEWAVTVASEMCRGLREGYSNRRRNTGAG
jgi:tetratricopeptide (TPR) repeat protein